MQSQQSGANAGRAGSREADSESKAGAGETDKNLCKENSLSGSLEAPKSNAGIPVLNHPEVRKGESMGS